MNQLFTLKKLTLSPLDSVPFKREKEIQKIVENNTEELFGIRMIKSEFAVGRIRLDSLCFDEETKSFVIIEYKKGASYSVIDQGYSYLSTMLNNKSDFVLEFNENSEVPIKRNEVDWSQSKIIFVSPYFNYHQRNSVNFEDAPFELWEISRFSNNTVSLNQIRANSKESIRSIVKGKGTVIKNVSKEVKVYTEDHHLNKASEEIKALYFELKERVSIWENADFKHNKNYIGILNKNKLKIGLRIQKSKIKIFFLRTKDKFDPNDPKGIFKLNKRLHEEQYEYGLKNEKDLDDYLVMLLKQKYDS